MPRRNIVSRIHNSLCAIPTAILVAGFSWGCGQTPPAPLAQPTAPQSVAEPTTQPVAQLQQLTSVREESMPALVDKPLNPDAEAALRTMFEPGVSTEAWDAAQQKLIGLGEEAVPVLLKTLRSDLAIEREQASSTLVLLGPEVTEAHAIELAAILKDESEFVRANVASALLMNSEQSGAAAETLIGLLESNDAGLRQLAAMNLRSQSQAMSEHLPVLISLLTTETSSEVLLPLIEIAGELGPKANAGIDQLKRLAASGDPQVSQSASAALVLVQGEIQQTEARLPAGNF